MIIANEATIEIETPMAGAQRVPKVAVIKPSGKAMRPLKLKPCAGEGVLWLAERFGADRKTGKRGHEREMLRTLK